MGPANRLGTQVLKTVPAWPPSQVLAPRLWLLPLALLLCCGALAVNAKLPDVALRGVAPADLALYEADPLFCRDASHRITPAQINDDFCDCPDGFDEPGTSACSTGRFFCRNKGHHPISVFSSRVNDGICDCCDGSDEWAKPGFCPNTCLEAGAAYRAQLVAEAAAFSEGNKVYAKYLKKAQTMREHWASELEKARAEKGKQEAEEQALKARKEEMEAAEKAQREWREEQEKAAKAAEAPAPIETPAVPPEGAPTPPEKEQEESSEADGGEEGELSEGEATEGEEAEGTEEESPEAPRLGEENAAEDIGQLSAEEMGRRVASRWTHDEDAVGGVQVKEERRTEDEKEAREEQEKYGEGGEETEAEEGAEMEPEEYDAQVEASKGSGSLLSSATGFLRRVLPKALVRTVFPGPPPDVPANEVESARSAYLVATSKLTELTNKVTSLEGKLERDYGPDGIFAALADECFEVTVNQYKYKVCMYESATQEENGQSVRLGSWAGWLDNYTAFHFTNGQQCWNGPMRSLKVRLRCGPKNELSNFNEPSRCEYTADLTTPALCTKEVTQAVKDELATAERTAKEVKDEL